MRILITGCRRWACAEVADWVAGSILAKYGRGGVVVVHGAAPGVDSTVARACMARGIATEAHPADWDGLGRGAGPRRNQAMVDAGAAFALAIHRDLAASRGTGDCVRRCLAAGIPTYHVDGVHSIRRIHAPNEVRNVL